MKGVSELPQVAPTDTPSELIAQDAKGFRRRSHLDCEMQFLVEFPGYSTRSQGSQRPPAG
jgi:hypothetical protein